ncbi:MAG: glycosyltransferase [Thermodesulfobacteriota bacterium]
MNNFSISVVLPAYNEEKNIKNTLSESIDFLDKRFEDYEIIAVNDGSSDRMDEKLDLILKWMLVWLKN